MDLTRLRYFSAVAQAGSFSRAAAALHLSQPALSRQVLLLETELGQRLFERTGRGAQLTESGAALLEHAIRHARDMGATRISLETGSNAAYAAARALYERAGFVRCKRFGSYPPSRFSQYYTLDL